MQALIKGVTGQLINHNKASKNILTKYILRLTSDNINLEQFNLNTYVIHIYIQLEICENSHPFKQVSRTQ